jgi:hypothetical protein
MFGAWCFPGACPPSAESELCSVVRYPPCGRGGLVARESLLRRTGMLELVRRLAYRIPLTFHASRFTFHFDDSSRNH